MHEIEAAGDSLGFTAIYQVTKNLNNSETRRYLKYEELLTYLPQPSRRYRLGVTYKL